VIGRTITRWLALAGAIVSLTLSVRGDAGNGLSGKLIVGYQGWFGCPNDYEGNKDWQHWFVRGVRPDHMRVDLLPSVRLLDPQDLCDTGLSRAGKAGTVRLFSSQNPNVVNTHFRWMQDAGIDGAAIQRFIFTLPDPARLRRNDHLLNNVRAAAEATNRVFFLVYDVSGAEPQTVIDELRLDWRHLVNDLKLIDSPAYLRDHGKPVLELWGFGFSGRPGEPKEVAALINDLKKGRAGLAASVVIGGVPAHWRTLDGDSKAEGAWAKIYRSYDVISPWSVGRFSDAVSEAAFLHGVVTPDLAETRQLGIRYLPVIFPGFSWQNLQRNQYNQLGPLVNQIPRRCGQFLWGQASDLLAQRVDMLYAAMFDELDEGTALFPAETREDMLPAGSHMVYLNQDGCSLPDDWYLRVTGKAAQYLQRHDVPPRNLQDVIKP